MAAVVHVLRIGGKGRVVLPVALRAEAHLEEGDELIAYVEGGRITMETRDDVRRRLRALAAEARTLGRFLDVFLAQDGDPRVPALELVDAKLHEGRLEG